MNKKKEVKKFLENLRERVEPTGKPGRRIEDRKKITRKDRKHSGRITSKIVEKVPLSYLRENCMENNEYWDDWLDWRDSMRDEKKKKLKFRDYKKRKVYKVL